MAGEMTGRRRGAWLMIWTLVTLLLGLAPVWAAGERLVYRISYQGLFSAFSRVDIADAELLFPEPLGEGPGLLGRLTLTTAPYGLAERLYPLRYDYRSWAEGGDGRWLLAVSRSRGSEPEDQLNWPDYPNGLGYRFKRKDGAGLPLPGLEELRRGSLKGFWQRGDGVALPAEPVFDYLALFRRLRHLPWQGGERRWLNLFTGRAVKRYRVDLFHECQKQAGGALPLLRIELREAGDEEPQLSLWLSRDPRRLPVRMRVERAFGVLEARLLEPPVPQGDGSCRPGLSTATESSLRSWLGDF